MMAHILPLAAAFLGAVGLLLVGDWLRRESRLVAHGLGTAGIVSLFYLWSAATPGDGYFPWWVGAGLMFATAMLAGVLSLRFGWLLVVVGVIGGFCGGAWIPRNAPDFTFVWYLLLFMFGMVLVPAVVLRIQWSWITPPPGLELQPPLLALKLDSPLSRRLEGKLRGFRVTVARRDRAIGIEVRGVDPGFTLRRETVSSKFQGRDVETGDPKFDGRTLIKGNEDLVLALLDHSTRRKLGDLLANGYDGIYGGVFRKKVFAYREIRPTLDSMLDLAEALRRPKSQEIPELLSRRALEDPSPGVRLRALHRLPTFSSQDDTWRETALELWQSGDEPLRTTALQVLLQDTEGVAAEVAAKLMDVVRQSPDLAERRESLDAVAASAFAQEYVADLVALLAKEDTAAELRLPALRGLIEARALLELLQVELSGDGDEAVELARGLGQIGNIEAQPRLFELLRHPRDRVKAEAAEALGVVGDVRAVEKLRKALDSGFFAKLTVGGAAESAIAKIQGRLGGSQAGELSVVADSSLDGAVSPFEDDEGPAGGEVSLAE